ncbi:MAG: nucleotidyltransferase family protein, partial [Clostridiales bacterium]|nr:nucleotidyltransferase family protein [Clostridiales bacterium]
HIAETKRITGADYIVVVMSGNFTQRGVPAFCDKFLRTQMALLAGADLVLELPVCYATGSAEFFAKGAVTLLHMLGSVDFLCFGSECGDITLLSQIADLLNHETPEFKFLLKKYLSEGLNYPKARSHALEEVLKNSNIPSSDEMIQAILSPNNLLGIEYLRVLKQLNSTILPFTVTRLGSGYHDKILIENLSSATAIRTVLLKEKNLSSLKSQVPFDVYTLMKKQYGVTFPICHNDFSSLLHYQLLSKQSKGYTEYLDVTEELSFRIKNQLSSFVNFDDFCDQLKTKEVTYSRISRCLLHILLDIKKNDIKNYMTMDTIFYARILGFRKDSSNLLSTIKKTATIPIITKLADGVKLLDDTSLGMLERDIFASHIYHLILSEKFQQPPYNEYRQRIVIV